MEKNSYYNILLKREWSYTTGAVIMAVLAVMLATFAGNWGVAGALGFWGGKFLMLIGINADSWAMYNGSLARYNFLTNQPSITNVALILGAAISSLLAAQWKIRGIRSVQQVSAAVIGGLLMGIGARIAPSCSIGALFSAIPAMSLSGWIFLVFVFLGATVGGKIVTKWFMPPVSYTPKNNRKKLSSEERRRNRIIQIVIGSVLIVVGLIFAFLTRETAPAAGFILFIGMGLGYAIQRSRFCFTAAYRDPTMIGSTKMTKALIIALAVATLGFAGIHLSRYGVDLSRLPEVVPGNPIGLHLVIGSFIFGIGAVLAGGCGCGVFIRVGEGCVQGAIALIFFIAGNIMSAPFMTNVVQQSPFLYSGRRIYLPELLGGFGPAILLQLLVLLLLWIAADRWEKRKKPAAI